MIDVEEAVTRAHHEEWARVVAALTRRFGDLDIAEEAAAEAFATAVERWPADGAPPNPGGWLATTAHRKAIDRIRRENKRGDKQKEAQLAYGDDPPGPAGPIGDERLRLIFTCCHPALALQTRVALTLRLVGGLTVPEIARAFLVPETTMGQRITRAKAKIKAARIPYRVPSAEDLPARVSGVLAVLYLVFNEGYLSARRIAGLVFFLRVRCPCELPDDNAEPDDRHHQASHADPVSRPYRRLLRREPGERQGEGYTGPVPRGHNLRSRT